MDADLTDFDFFLHCLKTDGWRMDETSFYFADDPAEAEHLIGYLPQYETPYWAGYCDIPDGCEFRTAEELVNAKIYGNKSLCERWASVRLINVGGIPLKDFH